MTQEIEEKKIGKVRFGSLSFKGKMGQSDTSLWRPKVKVDSDEKYGWALPNNEIVSIYFDKEGQNICIHLYKPQDGIKDIWLAIKEEKQE
jgi:hypothetical protein